MTSSNRTPTQKALDWSEAFNLISNSLVVPQFDQVVKNLGLVTPPDPESETFLADFNEYLTAINASLSIVRVVRADTRTAAIVAAMLTQSGVSRPTIDVTEE